MKTISKILTIAAGAVAGMFLAYFLLTKQDLFPKLPAINKNTEERPVAKPNKVIGFLPFWLINKAKSDYSGYITQLSYFNVVIDTDGSIQKFTSPGESDPGWHSLFTGKVDDFLISQKNNGIELSLTVFSGDDKKIDKFLEDPITSADNLINDLAPVLAQYGFKDLNLDIEKVSDASPDQRRRYIDFVRQVRTKLDPNITITIDVVGTSFVKNTNLCNPAALAEIADYIVLMGYDFHNPGSSVTGPVAPQTGAGIVNEFDIESAIQAARTQIPSQKLILAIPLYGYAWETIQNFPRAAVMPGSAYSMSSRSVSEMLAECKNCVTQYDKTDQEAYTIYQNETGLYQQVFYPNKESTQIKVDFAKTQKLGGLALWALGYEDDLILEPLKNYLK